MCLNTIPNIMDIWLNKLNFFKEQYKQDWNKTNEEIFNLISTNYEVKQIIEETSDPDLLYLAGDAYLHSSNSEEANKYFYKIFDSSVIDSNIPSELIFSEVSDPLTRVITSAIKANDTNFLDKIAVIGQNRSELYRKAIYNNLYELIVEGKLEDCDVLLEHIGNLKESSDFMSSLLHIASVTNNIQIVEHFMKKDHVNIEGKGVLGLQAIQIAARRVGHEDGNIEIIKLFLDNYTTPPDKELLFNLDRILNYGPTYISKKYHQYVKEKFPDLNLDWTESSNADVFW